MDAKYGIHAIFCGEGGLFRLKTNIKITGHLAMNILNTLYQTTVSFIPELHVRGVQYAYLNCTYQPTSVCTA